MNRTLARILVAKLCTLPYVEYYGGLVTVVTKTDTLIDDQTGSKRSVVSRFPIVTDLTIADTVDATCIKMPFQIVPDSKTSGLIYFEDMGMRHAARNQFTSNLKLVCWLNVPVENDIVAPSDIVILNIFEKLRTTFNSTFKKIQVVGLTVNRQGESNFASYTYDQNVRQYLMPPYEHFSIDLTISFDADLSCLTIPNPISEC